MNNKHLIAAGVVAAAVFTSGTEAMDKTPQGLDTSTPVDSTIHPSTTQGHFRRSPRRIVMTKRKVEQMSNEELESEFRQVSDMGRQYDIALGNLSAMMNDLQKRMGDTNNSIIKDINNRMENNMRNKSQVKQWKLELEKEMEKRGIK